MDIQIADIKEIVRIQLMDVGINASDIHYNICLDFYRNHGYLPDVNYIICTLITDTDLNSQSDDNDDLMENNDPNENLPNVDPIPVYFSRRRQTYTARDLLSFQNNLTEEIPQNMVDVLKVINNIDDIPLEMYKNVNMPNGNSECLICYDPFVPTDIIRILPCKHILHMHCIDNYLKNKSHKCPYCKMPAGDFVYINL
jgi:hypothetical protein